MADSYEDRLKQLREKERGYYEKHPPSTLNLIPSRNKRGEIEVSRHGSFIYIDDATGIRHSESAITFPIVIEGVEKWVTVPSIWPGEISPTASKEPTGRYWNEDQLIPFIKRNLSKDKKSFVNPITNESFPVFTNRQEADRFAIERDMTLQENNGLPPVSFVDTPLYYEDPPSVKLSLDPSPPPPEENPHTFLDTVGGIMKDLAGEPPPEIQHAPRGGGQRMRVRSGPARRYGLQK